MTEGKESGLDLARDLALDLANSQRFTNKATSQPPEGQRHLATEGAQPGLGANLGFPLQDKSTRSSGPSWERRPGRPAPGQASVQSPQSVSLASAGLAKCNAVLQLWNPAARPGL